MIKSPLISDSQFAQYNYPQVIVESNLEIQAENSHSQYYPKEETLKKKGLGCFIIGICFIIANFVIWSLALDVFSKKKGLKVLSLSYLVGGFVALLCDILWILLFFMYIFLRNKVSHIKFCDLLSYFVMFSRLIVVFLFIYNYKLINHMIREYRDEEDDLLTNWFILSFGWEIITMGIMTVIWIVVFVKKEKEINVLILD